MVAIQFKDHPALTWTRRQIIQHDFSRARIFLTGLGLPTPEMLPPIAVNERQSGVSFSEPVYRGEFQIQPSVLASIWTNRSLVTGEYFSYVMYMDTRPLSKVAGVSFLLCEIYQGFAYVSLGEYFNSAYWNRNITLYPWAKRLWAIRDAIGEEKADRVIAYTTKLMIDNPGADFYVDNSGNPTKGFDVYFSRKLKTAYSIVVSESASWDVISKILEKDGISVR